MKANIQAGYNHNRQKLAELVPLSTPFALHIAPTHRCNFRCHYCTHGLGAVGKQKAGLTETDFPVEYLPRLVEQVKEFTEPLKMISFTGLGESLLYPELPKMIRLLSQAQSAETYDIITNGYLLTPEKTDQLIAAGLNNLRISLQGLTAEKYREVSGVKIDYDQLFRNIEYFYHNKGNCKLNIKIIDSCLEHPEDEQVFYQMFGDLCDTIFVEHLVEVQLSMAEKYEGLSIDTSRTMFQEKAEDRIACPYPFYMLQIDANGNVFPCCPLGLPLELSVGNMFQDTLKHIWHGKKLYDLWTQNLKGKRSEHPVCGRCTAYQCFTPPEDNLDLEREQILKKVEERGYV